MRNDVTFLWSVVLQRGQRKIKLFIINTEWMLFQKEPQLFRRGKKDSYFELCFDINEQQKIFPYSKYVNDNARVFKLLQFFFIDSSVGVWQSF